MSIVCGKILTLLTVTSVKAHQNTCGSHQVPQIKGLNITPILRFAWIRGTSGDMGICDQGTGTLGNDYRQCRQRVSRQRREWLFALPGGKQVNPQSDGLESAATVPGGVAPEDTVSPENATTPTGACEGCEAAAGSGLTFPQQISSGTWIDSSGPSWSPCLCR